MMNKLIPTFFGAISFYTTLRVPSIFPSDFNRICRWLTLIGVLIGALLGLIDFIFQSINLPIFTRSILIISIGILLTGGLHLDGVIDTADGLAVQDEQRRLDVMKDSVTGAFGVMSAVILILIKTIALSEINSQRWLVLIMAATWGRWAQLMAIAFYPYLRETGKGKFHKESFVFPQDFLFGSLFIIALILSQFFFTNSPWLLIIVTQLACGAIALITSFWFNHQLGGHTGDTYGATIEWSEALIICLFTILLG